jgi:Putative zinc-finger
MKCELMREERVDVLYGEATPDTIRRVEDHLSVCPDCREEMGDLRRVRRDLQVWKVPESRRPAFAAPRPRRLLAAAAALLLAAGALLGLSGSEVRYEDGHFSFRLGRAEADVPRLLAEQEARHQREIQAIKAALAGSTPHDDAAVLARAAEMIRESEARQDAELRTSLAGFERRVDAQRRFDLARVSAGLSYLDGKTGQHVARTTEIMGYVLEASQKR